LLWSQPEEFCTVLLLLPGYWQRGGWALWPLPLEVLKVQQTHSEIAEGIGGLKGSLTFQRCGASGRDSEYLFVVL
jgi:hypothetical protein